MRVMRLKDGWDSSDSSLVINNRFSEFGLTVYWSAVDSSFKYNSLCREIYMAKNLSISATDSEKSPENREHSKFRSSDRTNGDSRKRHLTTESEDSSGGRNHEDGDPMHAFFRRRQSNDYEGFQRGIREEFYDSRGPPHDGRKRDCFDKFLLPRLRR